VGTSLSKMCAGTDFLDLVIVGIHLFSLSGKMAPAI
jgi:hypothetical protein